MTDYEQEFRERLARVETKLEMLCNTVSDMQHDIKFLRSVAVERDEFLSLQKKVNGITSSTQYNRGKSEVIGKIVMTWVAQGGVIGSVLFIFFKLVEIAGLT